MSWMKRLYETYEANADRALTATDTKPLLPVSHILQQSHVEVFLSPTGDFLRATVIDPTYTVIAASETSSVRTTNDAPHGLCDKVQYVAGDYQAYGGRKKPYFSSYLKQLREWCEHSPHSKSQAVLTYVEKRSLVQDLVKAGVFHVDAKNVLLTAWDNKSGAPSIFRILMKKEGVQEQGDSLVRWRVETPGDPVSGTWEDPSLAQSWIDFVISGTTRVGRCQVTGLLKTIARKHHAKLRSGKDGAKLISSNDESGFTFRGRFYEADQAVVIGSDVTEKAHSALRWLIGRRQGHHNGSQVIVTWAVSGKSIPDIQASSDALFGDQPELQDDSSNFGTGDVGQAFARKMSKLIAGYKATLGPADGIVTMAVDSATPGRMAVTFYRELKGSEFLDRIGSWHTTFAWTQQFAWDLLFVGAPSPKDIAAAAYGDRADDKILRSTVERLLPCIVDGRRLPRDLMEAVTHRIARRIGMASEKRRAGQRQIKYEAEWEKLLGIACSLFRGFYKERNYAMALDTERTTRDYLYGRLLAIAEQLEKRALFLADENRDTTAARLMQRFCDHPYSTWLNIEKRLQPYRSRLQVKNAGFLRWITDILDEVHCLFATADYMDDRPLSGEYLLGYHCQRSVLNDRPERSSKDNDQLALVDDSSVEEGK